MITKSAIQGTSCAAAVAALTLIAPVQATAGVTFFTDRTNFDAAAGTLSEETFANLAASVGLTPGHDIALPNPLNSTTQPVIPGFSLVAAPGVPTTGTSILQDFMGISGIAVSSLQFNEDFALHFNPNVTAVGFDVDFFNPAGGITPFTISVNDASGAIGSETISANGFFGVIVTGGDRIDSIGVPQPGNGSEIEDLVFGGAPVVTAVPEPQPLAALGIGLIGLALFRGWMRKPR